MADPKKQTDLIYYLYLQYEWAIKSKSKTAIDSIRVYCEKSRGWAEFVNIMSEDNPVRIDYGKYLETFEDIDWYEMDNRIMNYLKEMDNEIRNATTN